eukprot:m.83275 g.83275  ORF g.83275 m.83275 type:complete len:300 (-) comp14967_c0_seq2:156-1055(-)
MPATSLRKASALCLLFSSPSSAAPSSSSVTSTTSNPPSARRSRRRATMSGGKLSGLTAAWPSVLRVFVRNHRPSLMQAARRSWAARRASYSETIVSVSASSRSLSSSSVVAGAGRDDAVDDDMVWGWCVVGWLRLLLHTVVEEQVLKAVVVPKTAAAAAASAFTTATRCMHRSPSNCHTTSRPRATTVYTQQHTAIQRKMSRRQEVLQLFRTLLRTRARVFAGDKEALAASRNKIRAGFKDKSSLTDDTEITKAIALAKGVELVLRQNVAQASLNSRNIYELKLRPEMPLLENAKHKCC